MKIFLLTSSLNTGGAERVISILSNNLADHSNEVFLVSHSKIKNDFYPLRKEVNRIELSPLNRSKNPYKKIRNNYTAIQELRRIFKTYKPDIIISFLYQVNIRTIIANKDLRIPLIISDRSNPELQSIEFGWKLLRWLLYNRSDRIVIQNSRIKKQILRLPKIVPEKISIIPNPIPDYSKYIKEDITEILRINNLNENEIIGTLGSLTHAKGHDLLIRSFHKIADRVNYKLIIIGDGILRNDLLQLIDLLKLKDRVFLIGKMKNPFKLLVKFKMFLFSSRYEGFPNALLEAMSLGLPVISFDCQTGPAELITNEKNGILVKGENIDEMAQAILKLDKDNELRMKLARNSKDVITKYSVSRILNLWQNVINNTARTG